MSINRNIFHCFEKQDGTTSGMSYGGELQVIKHSSYSCRLVQPDNEVLLNPPLLILITVERNPGLNTMDFSTCRDILFLRGVAQLILKMLYCRQARIVQRKTTNHSE